MSKQDISIEHLVSMVESRQLVLPEMQRRYVWSSTRVRDLFDSLYRGYPSGVILAWETDLDVETQETAVDTFNGYSLRPLLLLDGQQRLTSLTAVLRGLPVTVRNRRRPIEILFNLDHPEDLGTAGDYLDEEDEEDEFDDEAKSETIQDRLRQFTFVVANKQLESLPNWVRVTDIFSKPDSQLLSKTGITDTRDPRYDRYTNRINRVRAIGKYEYRMDVLEKTKSYEEVTEIFVRVNSLGATLKRSDLALAQVTAKWPGSLGLFQKFQDEFSAAGGLDIEIGTLLRALVVFVTNQAKFQNIASAATSELISCWEQTKKALNYARNFLSSNLGITSSNLLTSPSLLVVLAYWIHTNKYVVSTEETNDFMRWIILANAKGRFSKGSSDTLLTEDIVALRNGKAAKDLISRLEQQVGRLSFEPSDLVGKNTQSGIFKTLMLAYTAEGATDWATNLKISATHSGKSDPIEYHHIFPKAFLKRERPELAAKEINDLANLAFISAETNRKIGANAPKTYKLNFDEKRLLAQDVDFSTGFDTADQYENFLATRRASMIKSLNSYLEKLSG